MLAQERTEAVGCGAHIQAIGGSGVGGVATAIAAVSTTVAGSSSLHGLVESSHVLKFCIGFAANLRGGK